MLYDAMDNKPLVFVHFPGFVALTSVAGSYVGYLIGQRWGRQLLDKFAKQKHVDKLEALTVKYGTAGIFVRHFRQSRTRYLAGLPAWRRWINAHF